MIDGKMGFVGRTPGKVYRMGSPKVPTSASGTNLILSSAAAPLTALTLYGKSEQETTTGAQLANFPDVQEVENNGVTWSCENGVMHATGTAADDKYSVFNSGAYIFPVVAGTYYVSSNSYDAEVYVSVLKNETTQYYKNSTFTLDGTETQCKIYAQVSPGKTVDETIYAMLNAGDTALPWEPYTGGQPSPSPDYPQEIKSVGDSGTINVSLSDGGSQSQILPVQTPNGLPGIPVDSGGNYTDASGQQWVCNYRDYARGLDVQCVEQRHITSDDAITLGSISDGVNNRFQLNLRNNFDVKPFDKYNIGVSNYFQAENTSGIPGENKFRITYAEGTTYILFNISTDIVPLEDIDAFKAWLSEHDLIVYYMIAPVETPIPPEEIAAYAALRTYSPTTVVSNDAGAWMRVGYYGFGAIERLARNAARAAERK